MQIAEPCVWSTELTQHGRCQIGLTKAADRAGDVASKCDFRLKPHQESAHDFVGDQLHVYSRGD
jgi:hypothetical protein